MNTEIFPDKVENKRRQLKVVIKMNGISHSEETGTENEETETGLEFTRKDEIVFVLYGIFVFIMSYPVGKIFIREEEHPLLEMAFGSAGTKVLTAIGRFIMGYMCITIVVGGILLIILLITLIIEKREKG